MNTYLMSIYEAIVARINWEYETYSNSQPRNEDMFREQRDRLLANLVQMEVTAGYLQQAGAINRNGKSCSPEEWEIYCRDYKECRENKWTTSRYGLS